MARNIFSVPRNDEQPMFVRDDSWKSGLVRGASTLAPKGTFISKASEELADKYDCENVVTLADGRKLPLRSDAEGKDDDVLVLSTARGEDRPTSGFFMPLEEAVFVEAWKPSWKDFVLRKDCIHAAAEVKKTVDDFWKIHK